MRAMGLTLASPDDICNCCEPHQAPKPNILKPRIFSRELDFHSREWQPPSNTQRELGAKPKLSLHSKKEVESEVGTIIEDEFALPEAAQKPATDKQPNRSLFQCRWTPPHSTCLNVIEDTQKTQKSSVESPSPPISSADENSKFTSYDSDSDYTTESPQRSPQRLPRTPSSDLALDLKNEDWSALGQEVGSVLDHLRVENSKSALMHEYAYWTQGTNC